MKNSEKKGVSPGVLTDPFLFLVYRESLALIFATNLHLIEYALSKSNIHAP